MSISFNKIIHKLDRIIQPQKYYTNNVTKKLNKLEKGDKVYALFIPDIKHMAISTSMSALEEVIVTACTVYDISISKMGKPFITATFLFKSWYYSMFSELTYHQILNMGYVISLVINGKEVEYTFIQKKYNGFLILSTNKNAIISHIKALVNIIKDRILERVMFNEEHKEQENIWTIYQHNETEYGNYLIINYKKLYAQIMQQLILL